MRKQLAAWLMTLGLLVAACERRPKPAPPPAPVPAAAAQTATNAVPQTDAGTEANSVHPPDNTVHEKSSKASPNP